MRKNGYDLYKKQIDKNCSRYRDWPVFKCLLDDDTITSLTYGELYAQILQFHDRMEELGLKAGDRVVIMDKHLPSAERTFISATYWNLTAVMVDASLPAHDIHRLIELTDVRAIFTCEELAEKLDADLKEKLPVLDIRPKDTSYPLLSVCSDTSGMPATPDPDTTAIAILFSSGTTGSMKPIVISYNAILHSWQTNTHVADLRHEQEYLYVFPLSHVSGLESSLTLFLCGATLDMVETFTAAVLPKALQAYQPHIFGMVPKVFDIMVQKMEETIKGMPSIMWKYYIFARKVSSFFQKKFGNRAVGHAMMSPFTKKLFGKNIQVIFTGSSMCAPETASAIMDMGVYWCNLYASTECGAPIATTDRFDRYVPDSVGNVKHNKGIEVIIHNPDEKGVGEIYVKSTLMMTGYFRDPELTKDAFDNGYFKTGDLGYINEEGYLYLAGRSKESIQLHNGKKVAPSDLEQILAAASPLENAVVICGVPEKQNRFDEIHAFFEDHNFSAEERARIREKLLKYAREKAPLYPIKDVHFMKEIPKTSVFKVKRYLLAKYVQDKRLGEVEEETAAETVETVQHDSRLATLLQIIRENGKLQQAIKVKDRLNEDLGLDSLTMYEIVAAIENKWGVYIGNSLKAHMTVQDVADIIENPELAEGKNTGANADGSDGSQTVYPKERGLSHKMAFNVCTALSRAAWKLSVEGAENLPKDTAYIICPNHESNLDMLWLFAALGKKGPALEKVASLAKIEILQNRYTRFPLETMGGIPVDRAGNTAEAIQQARRWLQQGGCLVLFPEGTRTRTGELGELKTGAAQLALEAGVPIVPVHLEGAYETYMPGTKLPKFVRDGGRCRISVTVKAPIMPAGQSPEELTAELRKAIATP